jgi:hypothetical protein
VPRGAAATATAAATAAAATATYCAAARGTSNARNYLRDHRCVIVKRFSAGASAVTICVRFAQ